MPFFLKQYSIISWGLWPPSLPDLNPCDFYLWGMLNDNVYSSNSHTERQSERRHSEYSVLNFTSTTQTCSEHVYWV